MKLERDDAKVGCLVLVALALFASFALHRTLRLLLKREALYTVRMTSVADLPVGTEVLLQGLRVGEVRAIEMERTGTEYRFVTTIGLRPDVVLWRGTRGVLVTRVVGGAFLDLRLPPPAERRVALAPGEPMEGETGASLTGLLVDVTALTANLDGLVSDLRRNLEPGRLEAILGLPEVRRTLAEARAALGHLGTASLVTQRTFAHAERTLDAFDRDAASLERSLRVLEVLMERRQVDLDTLIVQLVRTVQQYEVVGRDLEALLKEAGPDATSSLRALHQTLESTRELIELLKAKPNRLVFGTPSEEEREEAKKKADETHR